MRPSTKASGTGVGLEVGGLVLGARGKGLPGSLGTEPHFEPFLSDREADLKLTYRRGSFREPNATLLFDSGGVWRLYRHPDGKLRYDFSDDSLGREPYAQVLVEPGLRTGEVRLRTLRGHLREDTLHPFVYPLDEVLAISLLARRGGLHFHAAGIVEGGRGLLFPGVSGSGKSTTSRLWIRSAAATVLSDDRTIVRFHHGMPFIHGTPWHGEAELSSPGRARLDGVFFLEQADDNRALPMRPSEAAAELVARSFPAYWDPAGLETALDVADRVTSTVPSFRLRFRPDEGAVAAVREVLV